VSLRALLFLAFALVAVVPRLEAQVPPADDCPGGRIAYVFLDNNSIFDVSDPDLDARFRWAYRTANSLHVRTRKWVIRQELLFRVGDCYDPFLLAESERLLRAYPFLAQVDVYGVPQADGTHHVIVDTHDDWSTRLDVRIRVDNGLQLEGVRLSELNLFGTGQTLGLFFHEREVTRDYGLTYWTPQLGRTRLDVLAAGGRTRAGNFLREQVVYPFVGEVGRWSFGEAFSRNEQFFNYILRDDPAERSPHVLLPLREKTFDVSVLRRFGERGRALLLGAGLSTHQLEFPGRVLIAPEGRFDVRSPADSATAAPVLGQRLARDALRLQLLLGAHDVRWIVRQRLDGLRGDEDVRLGADAGLLVGRSIPTFGDDDVSLGAQLYGAAEAGRGLIAGRVRADARRVPRAAPATPAWQDLFLESALFAYLRPPPGGSHTLLLRADAAAAWRTRTPYQITLGGERGVRGYDLERFPGGRRLLLTLEDRILFGWPVPDVLDAGAVLFTDAGRVWAGDAPWGISSDWRASAGLGLRLAFPAGSRTPFRIDIAWPLERGTRPGDVQVRLAVGEILGLSAPGTDFQFRRFRPSGIAASTADPADRPGR
jgi:hypothetical protein